jgi:predicted membrane protein
LGTKKTKRAKKRRNLRVEDDLGRKKTIQSKTALYCCLCVLYCCFSVRSVVFVLCIVDFVLCILVFLLELFFVCFVLLTLCFVLLSLSEDDLGTKKTKRAKKRRNLRVEDDLGRKKTIQSKTTTIQNNFMNFGNKYI